MMNFSLKKALHDPLYRNSLIFFAGSFVGSFFGYLYHLAMGRMMRPEDYAIIASLLSIFLIVSVSTNTILTVVMRFTAKFQARKDISSVYNLQAGLAKWLFFTGLAVTALFVVFSRNLSNFLHIESVWPVVLMSLVFIFVFVAPIYRGILQGAQKFKRLAAILIIEAGTKLAAGIALVLAGFYVLGAIAAIVISTGVGLAFSWWMVRSLWKNKVPEKKKVDMKGVLRYAVPVIVVLLATTLLYNIDIVLVKHYFVGADAGYYAALSQLGKIIVFGTMAISGVMFPMVAEKMEKGENFRPVFWKAAAIVGGLSGLAILIYFLFPNFVIGLLYGPEYLPAAPLLGYVAIFMGLFALINHFVQFFLSAKSYGAIYPLVIGVGVQIVLLSFFHESLQEVIWVMDLSLAGLIIALLVFYAFESKRFKKADRAISSSPGL